MKCLYSILILTLFIQSNIKAQSLIAVQNGGAPAFYTVLQTAVDNAQSGDTIYIPGGSFNSIALNKKLYLIGVGHHPDSTNVTAKSIIAGISFSSGADASSIIGISFGSNGIDFQTNIQDLTISRCYMVGTWNFSTNPKVVIISNLSLTENILGTINFMNNCPNSSLNNNLITGPLRLMTSCSIKNNIFLYHNDNSYNPNSLYQITGCDIENNIFNSISSQDFSNCIFRNNVNSTLNGSDDYNNQGVGNFIDRLSLQSIFINYDPLIISGDGIYKADFHLKTDSPYKNAGTDGTDIGIYGGAFPWKAGSIPFNPHFQILKIAPKTDNNGNLNVKIKVAAQDN